MNALVGKDCAFFLLTLIGTGFLIAGILVRLGVLKAWFALTRVPTVVIPELVFGLIPMGLATLALGFLLSKQSYRWIPNSDLASGLFCCAILPVMLSGGLLAILQPRFVLPGWYHWLKNNYDDIMPQLQEDAQRIGRWEWSRMVRTQEGLERWAEEVRQRHQAGTLPK